MSSEPSVDDDHGLATVVDSLTKKFPDIPQAVIADAVSEAHTPMAEAPIQEYVSVLVEHQAQVRLNELEHDAQSATETESPDVSA
jgi:hypothetical protein